MENVILNHSTEHRAVRRALFGILAGLIIVGLSAISVSMVEPTTLKVTVTDATGAALSGATVASIDQPESQMALQGMTSSQGNMLIFSPVEPGIYQIQVSCNGYVSQVMQVNIARGTVANVTFMLKPS